jgi:hypothetical protein
VDADDADTFPTIVTSTAARTTDSTKNDDKTIRDVVDSDHENSTRKRGAHKRFKTEAAVPDTVSSSSSSTTSPTASTTTTSPDSSSNNNNDSTQDGCRPIVESSHLDYVVKSEHERQVDPHNVTLLLFYQYVEPPWTETAYQHALTTVQQLGEQHGLSGRMRVAKEGLNCTLTAVHGREAMLNFCQALRKWQPTIFSQTEFKLTHHLPQAQAFKELKIIPVVELVHYGLDGRKAPPITQYHGQHLEPADYHKKMTEDDTVMIDVRNHYEAQIGHFDPPAATWVDPNMRKSTEFPVWLDDPKTQEQLRGKVNINV